MTNTFNLQITKKWGEVEKKKAHKYGPVSSVIETDPVYIMQVFTKERASQYGKYAGIP